MRNRSKLKKFSCAVCKESFDCCANVVKHAEIHSNKTLYECLTGEPKSKKFKTPIDSKTTAPVEVQSEAIPESILKDAPEHLSLAPTWNEGKVPALHTFLTPFSIGVKVEEEV